MNQNHQPSERDASVVASTAPLDGIAAWFRRTFAGGLAVWAFVLLLGLLAIAAAITAWPLVPGGNEARFIVPLLVAGFALVEAFPVHLQFRSESASFSMLEIPLVVGLFYTSGAAVVLSIVAGAVVTLIVVRSQAAVKLVFNTANLALQAALAVLLFDALGSGSDPLVPQIAMAALLATLVSSTVNAAALATVIQVSEGQFDRKRFMNTVGVAMIVAVANTSLGLIAVVLARGAAWGITLLALPLGVLFFSYRALVSERTQREQVEFLYAATKSLQTNEQQSDGIKTLVREAAAMFRASDVQLLLFPSAEGEDVGVHYWITGMASEVQRDNSPDLDLARSAAAVLPDAQLVLVDAEGPVRDLLDTWSVGDAMIATLVGEEKVIGVLSVSDRVGTVGQFGPEDLRLFETLVYHASTALENDRLGQALAQLRLLERELSHQATHDALTGLPNRLQLGRHLEELAAAGQNSIELMFVDLDDFKLVNDTFGHSTGDDLLVEVGSRIRACLRSTDIVARLGGDEFAIVVHPEGRAQSVAERVISAVAAPMQLDGNMLTIGCSVGVASPAGSQAGSYLLRHADVAMYAAKNAGKGRIAHYTPDLGEELAAHQRLQQRVRQAMKSDELCVHYQPIYGLDSLSVVGAEALIRWNSDEGLRSAESFLSVAEESGFVSDIDRWVFETVLEDLALIEDHRVWHSCNISARTLQEDDIVEFLIEATERSSVRPSRVVLEVTETAAMTDIDANVEKLERLASAGFVIALDDFGTGFSSINHLRRLPVHYLKVAQPFVADVGVSGGETFIRAMINLGQTLGLEVIAEGIEQLTQLNELQALGCEMGQGYLLDRPMPANALGVRVRDQLAAMS